ncbi:hypothetical protein M434DRAFT_9347 [Hypoxylon sp. CO27-5]|nr:hypothetical protein M434DRAFT_9347 [Hypoxylon sp. CO27-5]
MQTVQYSMWAAISLVSSAASNQTPLATDGLSVHLPFRALSSLACHTFSLSRRSALSQTVLVRTSSSSCPIHLRDPNPAAGGAPMTAPREIFGATIRAFEAEQRRVSEVRRHAASFMKSDDGGGDSHIYNPINQCQSGGVEACSSSLLRHIVSKRQRRHIQSPIMSERAQLALP